MDKTPVEGEKEDPPPYSSLFPDDGTHAGQEPQSVQINDQSDVHYQPHCDTFQPQVQTLQPPGCPGPVYQPQSQPPCQALQGEFEPGYQPQGHPTLWQGPTNVVEPQGPHVVIANPTRELADTNPSYVTGCAIVLGVIHIVFGVVTLLFGITLGLPWMLVAALFSVSGILAIAGGCKDTECLVTATFIFSILSATSALNLLINSIFLGTFFWLDVHMIGGILLGLTMLIVATISTIITCRVVCGQKQPKIHNYASNCAIALGIANIVIGVISMVLVNAAISNYNDEHYNYASANSSKFIYIGWVGIGVSILLVASGSLAIAGGAKKTKGLLIATLVFSILVTIAAFHYLHRLQFSWSPDGQSQQEALLGLTMLIVATISAFLTCKVVCVSRSHPKLEDINQQAVH